MQIPVRMIALGLIAGPFLLPLAGCALPDAGRRYVGAGPSCGGQPTQATLVRRGTVVVLTPSNGTIALRGTVDQAGHVQAAWFPVVRGTATSARHPPATQSTIGTIDAEGAHLRFSGPGCEAPLELRQPGD